MALKVRNDILPYRTGIDTTKIMNISRRVATVSGFPVQYNKAIVGKNAMPPRGGNPLLDLDLPNLIVTPHVAWASEEASQGLADQLVDHVDAFVLGEPRNCVKG